MTQVLLIEDETAIADTIVYSLSTEGFQVRHVSTGREGLAALSGGGFALVILDVGLPDQSGFEVLKQLRQHSNVPVIFLTARKEEIDRVLGLELGADDYVSKPFSPRELSARVKAILRRAPTAPVTRQSPLVIDENKMGATYFGEPVTLTRYEFRLLKTLAERPGWVYSREQLMEAVWDDPAMSLDRTVDAHIKSLRAKLRKVRPEIDPIQTHRGTGYSFKEDW